MSARQVLGRIREAMGREKSPPGGWPWFAANVVMDAVADYDDALENKVPLAYLPHDGHGKNWWSADAQAQMAKTVLEETKDWFCSDSFDNFCDLAGYNADWILQNLGLKYTYIAPIPMMMRQEAK